MPRFLLLVLFLLLGFGWLRPVDELFDLLLRVSPDQVTIWTSHCGDMIAYLVALATVVYLQYRRPDQLPRFLCLLVGQHLLTHGCKYLFQTPRPLQAYLVGGYAYPSGHTMMAACLYGYLAYHARGMTRSLLLTLPLLVAWSRVALGHHWLSDVLGSLVLARLWLSLCVGPDPAGGGDQHHPPGDQ
ncbi:hypothetical protein ABS71_00785 [bacterium SCN 62-11]|nr:MAG: hypothetical protein ABS71_00785 [bacterium SCN 62-11]